jgi:glutaredoxin-like protein
MSLVSPEDQQRLRDTFSALTRPVRILFFTQTIGCETCLQTREILDELPPLSDKIAVEEVNLVLDREKAAQYGIDRAPAVALTYAADAMNGAWVDSRIRFLGEPSGYEFITLVEAIRLVGGGASALSAENRARVASIGKPTVVQVFTTPTCPHCPRAVVLAYEMALASANVTAVGVEATEFPDLARRYMVTGVPKTIVNETVEILGALPQDDFIEQALSAS